MIVWLKKNKFFLLLTLAVGVVYWVTRLVNLGIIPIFTDEAIYLRWSQIMAYDAAFRYLPLVDGKPPLFMWLVSFLIRVLPSWDLLLVGRLTAVFSGFFGLCGIFFTTFVLFRKFRVSLFAAVLYLVIPFVFFYDRFGLADSLLAALGCWSIGLGVIIVERRRLDATLINGLIIGFGFLTKQAAMFFLAFIPVYFLLFPFKEKGRAINLIKTLGLFAVVVGLSQMVFSILRLFPLFHMVSQKTQEFVVPLKEFLPDPLRWFSGNLPSLIKWEISYLTIGVVFLILIALFVAVRRGKDWPKIVMLFSLFFFPLIGIAAFNKVIYLRYLLPFTMPLLILAAVGLETLFLTLPRRFFLLCFVLVLIYPVFVDFKLLTDPKKAPIPTADSDQYLNHWPAGYGVSEVRHLLQEAAKNNPKVYVWTEGTFGLMPYALELYQKDYPNLEIKSFWPLPQTPPTEMLTAVKNFPVYLLMYQDQTDPKGWKTTEVARFQQGNGPDFLRLYKVNP